MPMTKKKSGHPLKTRREQKKIFQNREEQKSKNQHFFSKAVPSSPMICWKEPQEKNKTMMKTFWVIRSNPMQVINDCTLLPSDGCLVTYEMVISND